MNEKKKRTEVPEVSYGVKKAEEVKTSLNELRSSINEVHKQILRGAYIVAGKDADGLLEKVDSLERLINAMLK